MGISRYTSKFPSSTMSPTQEAAVPPPPQWVIELNTPVQSKSKSSSLPDPPGFTSAVTKKSKDSKTSSTTPARKPPTPAELDTLKMKKAWELAIAPAKQLPMNAIGMYMTGNSLQIFSIFMVFTLFKTPILAMLNLQNTFKKLESEGTRDKMGLLPYVDVLRFDECEGFANVVDRTTRSDWL